MNKRLLVILPLLAACAGAPGDDESDDPITDAKKPPALQANPATAAQSVTAGVKPGPASFTLVNTTTKKHTWAISCDSGAAAKPAKGSLGASATAPVSVDLQPPPAGDSKVTCSVTSPTGATHYGTFALTLHAGGTGSGDFTLSAAPASLSLSPGGSAATMLSVTPQGGFARDVSLTVSGLPAGASGVFSASTIFGGSGSARLTVSAGGAAAGSYTAIITGSGGSTTHTVAVAVSIAAQCTADTWGSFAQPFFSNNCGQCHNFGSSYSSVSADQVNIRSRITDGSMPPNASLAPPDKARILKWIGCGLPQ